MLNPCTLTAPCAPGVQPHPAPESDQRDRGQVRSPPPAIVPSLPQWYDPLVLFLICIEGQGVHTHGSVRASPGQCWLGAQTRSSSYGVCLEEHQCLDQEHGSARGVQETQTLGLNIQSIENTELKYFHFEC